MNSNYDWKTGAINWGGIAMNAVIIAGLTREDEDGFAVSVVTNQILADHQDISAAPARWAVFAKRPPTVPGE